jgi:hypothetical protein
MIEPTRALAAMALRLVAVEKANPQPNKKSEGSPRWEAQLIKCFKVADTVRDFPDPQIILVERMRHERGSAGGNTGAQNAEKPRSVGAPRGSGPFAHLGGPTARWGIGGWDAERLA